MQEKKTFSFSFDEYKNHDGISKDDLELIEAAKKASKNAYAPYSGFFVGASLRLVSGKIVTGANVENAAYPSGICAERNALANAIANHPLDHTVAIAIAASTKNGFTGEPASPCGMCRQVIAEEEYRSGKKIRIILYSENKILTINSISDMLPLQFSRDNLGSTLP